MPSDKNFVINRCHIIEFPKGAIIKRGRTELVLYGDGAYDYLAWAFQILQTVNALADIESTSPANLAEKLQELVSMLLVHRIIQLKSASGKGEEVNLMHWSLGVDMETFDTAMRRKIFVVGEKTISKALVSALESSGHLDICGFSFDEFSENNKSYGADMAALYLLCSAGVESAKFRSIHADLYRAGVEIVPIFVRQLYAEFGPWIRRGLNTPCYECLRARQNSNMEDAERERANEYCDSLGEDLNGHSHVALMAIINLIVAQINLFVLGRPIFERDEVAEFDPITFELSRRIIRRVPKCHVCDETYNYAATPAIRRRSFKASV